MIIQIDNLANFIGVSEESLNYYSLQSLSIMSIKGHTCFILRERM
jgi:hypothetical protein